MAQTIQRILEDAARRQIIFSQSEASMKWFYERARKTSITSSQLIREYTSDDFRNTNQVQIGSLYMFYYDPAHKETLPYYDTFPMIFLSDMWQTHGKTHFAGINLHYLPYKQRAFLMDALYDLENNASIPANKRLNLSYQILRQAAANRWFAPCYKRYLKTHVRSKLVKIPYEEWVPAVFLPVHEFEKATAAQVWRDSTRRTR